MLENIPCVLPLSRGVLIWYIVHCALPVKRWQKIRAVCSAVSDNAATCLMSESAVPQQDFEVNASAIAAGTTIINIEIFGTNMPATLPQTFSPHGLGLL